MSTRSSHAVSFDARDFAVLALEGFQERMEALRARLTPKLQALGEEIRPDLEAASGERSTCMSRGTRGAQ